MTGRLPDIEIGPSRRIALGVVTGLTVLAVAAMFAVLRGWSLNIGVWTRPTAKAIGATAAQLETGLSYGVPLMLTVAALLIAARRLMRQTSIVTLSAHGIVDRRVTPQLIPWSAIQDVSTYRSKGGKVIALHVEPAILATLPLPSHLKANRALGRKAITIDTNRLGIRWGRLKRLITVYHTAATHPLPSSPS